VCGHFAEFELRIEDFYKWREEHQELVIQPDEEHDTEA